MQKITMFFRANDTLGTQVDQNNDKISTTPSLTRGMQAELILNLLNDDGTPLEMENYTSWLFVLASDWDVSTPPQVMVNEGITSDGNQVRIPLLNTNTQELATYLGTSETKTIGAELVGFQRGEEKPNFVLQFNLNIRNRRSEPGCGEPTELPEDYYTREQVEALLGAADEFEFVKAAGDAPTEEEAASPHTEQAADDTHFHQRNSAVKGEWSPWMKLLQGTQGEKGETIVRSVYVAYATDAEGNGFTLAPAELDDADKYVAFLTSDEVKEELTAEDFAGLWMPICARTAARVPVADESGLFTGGDVEAVLQEIGETLKGLETTLAEI